MSNGECERWNGTVIRMLKRYVTDQQERWDESLPLVTYAYNTTVQRANKYSPYEVIFGVKQPHR